MLLDILSILLYTFGTISCCCDTGQVITQNVPKEYLCYCTLGSDRRSRRDGREVIF